MHNNKHIDNDLQKIRVTKEFRFEMAHALLNYEGPCKNIHGHSYILQVTFMGLPLNAPGLPKDGLVVDFKEIKELVQQEVIRDLDHALVINASTADNLKKQLKEEFEKVITVHYQPTCENLLLEIKHRLQHFVNDRCYLFSLKLFETSSCWAEWNLSDNTQRE